MKRSRHQPPIQNDRPRGSVVAITVAVVAASLLLVFQFRQSPEEYVDPDRSGPAPPAAERTPAPVASSPLAWPPVPATPRSAGPTKPPERIVREEPPEEFDDIAAYDPRSGDMPGHDPLPGLPIPGELPIEGLEIPGEEPFAELEMPGSPPRENLEMPGDPPPPRSSLAPGDPAL